MAINITFGEWSYFSILVFICWFVWDYSKRLDDIIKPEIKSNLANWLRNYDTNFHENWLYELIRKIFNYVFGEKILSFKFIIMSIVLSTAFFFIIVFTWASFNTLQIRLNDLIKFPKLSFQTASFLVINYTADYLSLIETRFILFLFAKKPGVIRRIVLCFCDIVATALIFLSFFSFFWFLGTFSDFFISGHEPLFVRPSVQSDKSPDLPDIKVADIIDGKEVVAVVGDFTLEVRGKHPFSFASLGNLFLDLLLINFSTSAMVPLGLYFYTTFLTSIWVWLFWGGSILVKTFGSVLRIVDIESKPFRSIGIGIIVIIWVVGIVVFAFRG